MKTLFILILIGSFTAAVFGQDTLIDEKEQVVKITTSLIQLDVSITDSKGRIVKDIKPEEIEVFQDGKRQNITGFKFVSAVKEIDQEADKPKKNEPGIPAPPTQLKPEQIRRTIAIVIDDLTLSFESSYQTKRAVKKFIDEQMSDGDLVAIIRAGSGVGALQQFTSDKRILHAAADRIKWNPTGTGGISAFAPIRPSNSETASAMGNETITDEDIENEKNREESFEDFRAASFVTGTLGAIEYVISGMKQLPGRKSIVLFSDGFRVMDRDQFGGEATGRVFSHLRRLIDTANRSSVVFYTLDARGLLHTGLTGADDVSMLNSELVRNIQSNRSSQLFETQSGLNFLVQETGGISIRNNNDLIGGMRKILNYQSYYLISYEPDEDTFDPIKKFNKLEIKVTRPNTNLRYRRGFINTASDTDDDILIAQKDLPSALVSPFAINDIEVRLNPLYGYDPVKGSIIRSLMHIDTKSMKFVKGANGKEEIKFSVVAVLFGDNGSIVDSHQAQYTVSLDKEKVATLNNEGLVYNFVFPIKRHGAFQYRVALKDENSGKIGTASEFIEIPNIKKKSHQISGITLESFKLVDWPKFIQDAKAELSQKRDPAGDTSNRRFRQGTILYYNYGIYNINEKTDENVITKIRLFRENKIVLDGVEQKIAKIGARANVQNAGTGALNLDKTMQSGDYILQAIVIDRTNPKKPKIATRFVEFEVVE